MKPIFVAVAITLAFHSPAHSEDKSTWGETFRPLKGEYLIYGGALSETHKPTRNDRKVALKITGQGAKDFFESMQPDEKVTCTDAEGYRERRKGEVTCTFDRQDGYACYFGFDLRTGKSIGGASC